ncbi:MAG: MBL fold metallo-hydrolase [Limnochordia bacterium]
MELVIIGNSSPFPGPKGACPGYLVRADGANILLDCGPGTVAGLQAFCPVEELTGVILSHLHPDHAADLFVLGFALGLASREGRLQNRVPLYLPPDNTKRLAALCDAFGDLLGFYREGLTIGEYGEGSLKIGPFTLSFTPARHNMEAHLVKIASTDGILTYSGDTGLDMELVDFLAGSNLFLCEATLDPEEEHPSHLTAAQAGLLAAKAGVDQLLLTHFRPGADLERKKRDAAQVFSGPVDVALPGARHLVAKKP